jgi:hypothetical protein
LGFRISHKKFRTAEACQHGEHLGIQYLNICCPIFSVQKNTIGQIGELLNSGFRIIGSAAPLPIHMNSIPAIITQVIQRQFARFDLPFSSFIGASIFHTS